MPKVPKALSGRSGKSNKRRMKLKKLEASRKAATILPPTPAPAPPTPEVAPAPEPIPVEVEVESEERLSMDNTKAELLAAAEEAGIEASLKDTKADILELLYP